MCTAALRLRKGGAMAEEDNVFSRWSRRKRAGADQDRSRPGLDPGPLADAKLEEVPGQARDALEIAEPESEEEEAVLLERLGLPKPESMGEGDDFAPFMKAGVPEFLRKRALRVLWRSNPVLANLDGLNDYDEDFNSPELTQKVLATGYQVGRGFVKKVVEALEEDAPEDEVEEEAPVDNRIAKNNSKPLETEPTPPPDFEADEDRPARPRRMRFRT